jgi:hypothetical protein
MFREEEGKELEKNDANSLTNTHILADSKENRIIYL